MNILLALLLFDATYVNYYVPQPHQLLYFNKKGDLQINAGIRHQQAGYAITDYLGFCISRFQQKQSDIHTSETNNDWIRRNNADFHSAALIPFRKLNYNTFFYIPLTYGWGIINGSLSWSGHSDFSYFSSYRNYVNFINVQPTFTIYIEKFFDISVFSRYSLYSSKVLNTKIVNPNSRYKDFDEFLNNNNHFYDMYVDNGIQCRFGIKNLKCYAQISSLFGKKTEHKFNQMLSFRVGLSLNMNARNIYRNIKNKVNNNKQKRNSMLETSI